MAEIGTILDEIVGKIANAFNPEKIIIFGSYAYGRPTEKSDIDILVIMESNKREIERMVAVNKLLRDYHKKIDFNIIVKTPAEVKHRLESAIHSSAKLYQKERFWRTGRPHIKPQNHI